MRHYLFAKLTKVFWAFFGIFLIACTSTPGITASQAPSTVHPLLVSITPALRFYRQELNQCAQAQPDIALFVQETASSTIDHEDSDLQLRLGLPNQGVDYAFQVGEENLLIVINANRKAQSLTPDRIRAIFSGDITDWEQASGIQGIVHPWVYPEGNELEQIFDQLVMEGGHISSSASIAPDPETVQKAVAVDEGAIGFLPSSWLTGTIQAIELERNLAPQLNVPVLALTKSAPYGSLGLFVACLQKNERSSVNLH